MNYNYLLCVALLMNQAAFGMNALKEKQKQIAAEPASKAGGHEPNKTTSGSFEMTPEEMKEQKTYISALSEEKVLLMNAYGLASLFKLTPTRFYMQALNMKIGVPAGSTPAYSVGCNLLNDAPDIVATIKKFPGNIQAIYILLQNQFPSGSQARKKIDDFYTALKGIEAAQEAEYPKAVYALYKSAGILKWDTNVQKDVILSAEDQFLENPENIAFYKNVWTKKYELGALAYADKQPQYASALANLKSAQQAWDAQIAVLNLDGDKKNAIEQGIDSCLSPDAALRRTNRWAHERMGKDKSADIDALMAMARGLRASIAGLDDGLSAIADAGDKRIIKKCAIFYANKEFDFIRKIVMSDLNGKKRIDLVRELQSIKDTL